MKQNKRTAGFTLVELIVVIAIMGILAGVGTVGYSGYIKSANKKADIALVGNIERALETGSYSTMFAPPEGLSVSATTYPVGFIALTNDGNAQAIQSGTDVDYHDGECVKESISYYFLTKGYVENWWVQKEAYTKSELITVEYCKTHSINMPTEATSNIKFAKGYGVSGSANSFITINQNEKYFIGTAEEATTSNNGRNYFATFADGATTCNKEDVQLNPTYATNNQLNVTGELHQALVAAFGENYATQMVLQYGQWGIDGEEVQNFPSLLSGGNTYMSKVKDLSTTFTTLTSALIANNGTPYLTNLGMGAYTNAEDLAKDFAAQTVTLGTTSATVNGEESNAFMKAWLEVPTVNSWDGNAMGYGARRDYYSAARQSYNSAFATWLTANNYSQYASVVENYSKPISESGAVSGALTFLEFTLKVDAPETIPALICPSAFTDSNSGLKEQFAAASLTETDLAKCADLYDLYVSSGAAAANGQALLDTMTTVNDTIDEASGADTNSFFDYYQTYLNEMANLYNSATAYAKSGKSTIIITVTMNDGVLNCSVSPSAADPRNQ